MTRCCAGNISGIPFVRHQRARGWAVGCLLATLALIGCAPESGISSRDPAAPIGGTTRFEAQRFAGEWHLIGEIGGIGDGSPHYTWKPERGVLIEDFPDCAHCDSNIYQPDGPGILRQIKPDTSDTLVVMWVDEGFRTAAVGYASGARAMILDRQKTPAPDRLAAASDILDFYGWDISQLQMVTK